MDFSDFEFHGSYGDGTNITTGKSFELNIGRYKIILYIGILKQTHIISILSDPINIDGVDLDGYNRVNIEIHHELTSKSFNVIGHSSELKNLIKKEVSVEYNYSFSNRGYHISVPQLYKIIDIIRKEEGLEPLTCSKKEEDKVGGNCCVCGFKDDWGSWKDNRCYCYQHTLGH